MKKQSFFSSFTSFVGIVLGFLGISFLGYAIYLLFFIPEKQELLNILPEKNFEFILFGDDETHSVPEYITQNFPFPIPQKGTVVSYFNPDTNTSEYIVIISESSDNTTPNGIECRTTRYYQFCAKQEQSFSLYSVIEAIENNHSAIKNLKLFSEENSVFLEESSFSFAGKTSFLVNNINAIPLAFPQEKQVIEKILTLSNDALPYFSGNIRLTDNIYSLAFHKKENSSLFPEGISETKLSSKNVIPTANSYLYIRKPKDIISFLQNNADEESLPMITNISSRFKEWTLQLFDQKASWEKDISPLLATDIIIMKSENGTAMVSSFPTKELLETFHSSFSDIILSIASEKIAEKKGFHLSDGSMIYEIFPSTKDVQVKSQTSEEGEISIYTIKNSSDQTQTVSSISTKNTVLFLSDNAKSAEMFWGYSAKHKAFKIPLDQSVFFSFGEDNTLDSEQKIFNTAEITGKEDGNKILFAGKIDWNIDFFEKPVSSTLEDVEGNTLEQDENDSDENVLEYQIPNGE